MTELVAAKTTDIIESIFSQNPHLLPLDATVSYNSQTSPRNRVLNTLRILPIIGRLVPSADAKKELIARLLVDQKAATTYNRWYEISTQLDGLLENSTWKMDPKSDFYDYDMVHKNLVEMRDARLAKDYKLLLYLVRTKWIRNVGNMGDLNLYRHSHVGTKKLIEEYIEECQQSLHYLVNDKDVNLDDRYLLGMLIQTRKNIGRTALLLSGGSTFGVSHIGVLITLLETNLIPRIISGSSSGSIIASILCCHTNDEIRMLLAGVTDRKFNIFGLSDPNLMQGGKFKSFLETISHFLKYGTLYDIRGLQETMIGFVGDLTFREAYNRTGKILNMTVSPASMHEQTRLLNYLTAPNCLIWSAVCASCSLPGIFPSTSIYEKNPRTNQIHEWNKDESLKYVDGSVDGDLPITRLSEMFNVDHIIAVQVNPHVSPVLRVSVGDVGGKMESEFNDTLRNVMNNCYDFVTSEIVHYLQVLNEMDVYKNLTMKMISILSQRYSGDITILPELTVRDFFKIFQNPTPQFLLDFILKGARASWPKVTVINNHCGVEFALDKEISVLRGRLIASANNRLTFKNSSVAHGAVEMLRNGDSNAYLISSPVLNHDIDTIETTAKSIRPSTSHSPRIRRHNSIGNGVAIAVSKGNTTIHRKRNTISSPLGTKNMSKGKSTTSLQSLNTRLPTEGRGGEQTSAFRSRSSEVNVAKLHAEGYVVGLNTNLTNSHAGNDVRQIRKARSSGNFRFDQEGPSDYPASPISFRTSPKYEKTVHTSIEYADFASKLKSIENKTENSRLNQEAKEKANLPRPSKPNSLRNSYVGLNRLKDSMQPKSNVGSNNDSKDNSSQDLKDFYSENQQTLKGLNFPDLRRYFSKSRPDNTAYTNTPMRRPYPHVSFSSLDKDSGSDKVENTSEETDASNGHESDEPVVAKDEISADVNADDESSADVNADDEETEKEDEDLKTDAVTMGSSVSVDEDDYFPCD